MPAIRAFPLDQLPRISRSRIRLVRLLRRQLGGGAAEAYIRWASRGDSSEPGGHSSEVRGQVEDLRLGSIWTLEERDVPRVAARGTLTVSVVGPGPGQALLVLDAPLVSAVCSALMNVPSTPLTGKPTRAEQGLVLFALTGLLHELGSDCPWSIEQDPVDIEELEPEPGIWGGVEAQVLLGSRRGLAWLLIPASVSMSPATASARAGSPERLAGLEFGLSAAIGQMVLPLSEMEDLEPGDVILSPDCPARRDCQEGLLLIGSGSIPVRLDVDRLGVTAPFRAGGFKMTTSKEDQELALTDVLPVEIVIEVARLRLTGTQVLELSEGDVLTLDQPLSARVNLRVGDRLVAKGELVDVDGETGVRLEKVFD